MTSSPNGFAFRLADRGDAQRVAEVISRSFADVAERFDLNHDNCPAHASFITDADVRRGMELGTTFLLAFSKGRACGCVGFRQPKDGVCILEKLAVLPEFRRRGLGHALMERAVALIRQAGAACIEIGIIGQHRELRTWYEKIGFRSVRNARFGHLPFEVVYMQKMLKGCDTSTGKAEI
jgi:GNAT superfamily N-acetyltransferase